MYFPKLESLSGKIISNRLIINAVDEWLAYLPRAYSDRITPDMLEVDTGVAIEIVEQIFEEIVDLGILKRRYMIECDCGQNIEFYDNYHNVVNDLISYNHLKTECDYCGEHKPISTDNVYILYQLSEVPNKQQREKKTRKFEISGGMRKKTLSDVIINDIERFKEDLGERTLIEIGGNEVRSTILALNPESSMEIDF